MYYSNPKIEICQCETIAIRIGMIISFDGGPSTSDGGTPSLHSAGRKRDTRYASRFKTAGEHSVAARSK